MATTTFTTQVTTITADWLNDVDFLVYDMFNDMSSSGADGVILVSDGTKYVQESGATARTSLGLAIGTDVQAYDAELAALAGLTSAADKIPYFTGSGTAALADFAASARSLLGLSAAADKLPYFTSTTVAALADLTSFGRSLIDDAAASNARTTLGLVIGTDVQAFDTDLNSLAGLTLAQGDILYRSATQLTNLAAGTSGRYLQTQGAGANPQWAAVSATTVVEKASDETVNNSDVLQDDNELLFSVSANTKYRFNAVLFVTNADASARVKLAFTGPAAPTKVQYSAHFITEDGDNVADLANAFSGSLDPGAVSATDIIVVINGLVQNGANAGTVTLQWAQRNATVADTKVLAGSYLEYDAI